VANRIRQVPAFATEEEERPFWETHDSADFVDWDNAVHVRLPNLKLSSEAEPVTPASGPAAD